MKKKVEEIRRKIQLVLFWVLPPKKNSLINDKGRSLATPSKSDAKTMPGNKEHLTEIQHSEETEDSD